MADLKARFEQAVADSKQLPEKPDNMTLLKIYALYKQATKATWTASAPASPTWWAAPSGTPGTA
jgi:diazepam-binding inhibitor (GABA receptor modulating acyl-CoA-binding protein)